MYPFDRCYDKPPMMNRRGFLRTVSASVLVPALVAEAQQAGKMYRVGFLTGRVFRTGGDRTFEAFRQGLGELGWSEGRNVALEYRAAESPQTTPRLAAELVQQKI